MGRGNKMAKIGRPPLYSTSEKLQTKIDEYFKTGCTVDEVWIKGSETPLQVKRPTISGLVLYAGFCDRTSFYDYEKHEEFSYTIKKARAKIAQHYEELLQKGLGAGAIFALKNFGWVDTPLIDQSQHTHYTKVDINVEEFNRKSTKEKIDTVLGRV